ncbi:LutB/LldF family L-lactate oxidation iron-sulfur protein [Alicyclobacillus tolerans]|uniref:LutB/LldF family L-lactate oxidation iron-sulfur protein n=1 Tax=Alicyclobacillus tolerans TaxID=90970 RepID=UPI001EFFC90B|nr:LutB/LldF family L-lactate oxidation iron-sulfur protein [Alicyclobacillus tolerans]MCF8563218.1 LutB/LldF family L-lactate oxidation iron-sulfur protein [Alicyclobacillus tolerans]
MQSGLKERIHLALQNDQLHGAVRRAVDHMKAQKKATESQIPYEDFRRRASEIRSHTEQHLEYYLGQFAENVRKNGGHVHFCQTGEEAVQQVLDIAKRCDAKSVVKSKSMVTEELHLNHALEEAGIEAVETDLGEYIIQLDHETPSHIVGPSLHKTKEQVAKRFQEISGEEISADPTQLTAFARRVLRQKFLHADIGVSGCNFAVAETGSITLFTNEGNARMVTTLPRVHIAIMGMERIVPTLLDLEVMMNLLPRAATGQKLTSYVSMVSGPKKPGEIDGPEEFHVVVVDNHRSNMLNTEYQEALNCVRCGACLNACPAFRHTGGHAYGSVYSGPIGIVITPLLEDDNRAAQELPYDCSVCGACAQACPVMIPLPDMIVRLRARNVRRQLTPSAERLAFRQFGNVFSDARKYKTALTSGRILQKFVSKNGYIDAKVPGLSGWTAFRSFPELPATSFRDRVANGLLDQLKSESGGNKR